jgi:hypothetical protein
MTLEILSMWVWPDVELFDLGIDGRSCSACSIRDPYPECRIGFG